MANPGSTRSREVALLGSSALFARLCPEDLETVARFSALRSYRAGQPVFLQGSRAEKLYIVASGSVAVMKTGEDGREQDVARFFPGELFGEIDLVDTIPRNASAVAEEKTVLLLFPAGRRSFRRLVEEDPRIYAPVLHALLATVASRIRAANRLISERSPWIRELQERLYRDRLTGLHNRAWLDEELDALLLRHSRNAVLVAKPDNFKTINDTFGHEAGDRALSLMAEALRRLAREGELGARYRGDEFILVLPGSSAAQARERAEELRRSFGGLDLLPAPAGAPGTAFRLTTSIGIAAAGREEAGGRELIARAFERMLSARGSGGDRILEGDCP